jgi:hypothetical protein
MADSEAITYQFVKIRLRRDVAELKSLVFRYI